MIIFKGASVAALGVTVAICTYNGAGFLPATLSHLRAQIVSSGTPWEVLIVDNASTDNTAEVARRCWPRDSPTELRIVEECKPGLSNARARAFSEARYEIVSFVDDDNWVCPEWVTRIAAVMTAHAEVGACGAVVEAQCATPPPDWCRRFYLYSKWPVGDYVGDVSETLGVLMGSGLTIRACAYQEIAAKGFRQLASDRTGNLLMSGGDTELCLALRLAGWTLWLEPMIRLIHFIPSRRMDWRYFRDLVRGNGFSSVRLDPYFWALRSSRSRLFRKLSGSWLWQALGTLKALCQNLLLRPYKTLFRDSVRLEGDPDVVRIENFIGRLQGLWHHRRAYVGNRRAVAGASWYTLEMRRR